MLKYSDLDDGLFSRDKQGGIDEQLARQAQQMEEEAMRAQQLEELNQLERMYAINGDEEEADDDEEEGQGNQLVKNRLKREIRQRIRQRISQKFEGSAPRTGAPGGAGPAAAAGEAPVAAGAAGTAAAGGTVAAGGAAAAGGTGVVAGAAATSEIWVPILIIVAIIVLLIALVFFIISSMVAACNTSVFEDTAMGSLGGILRLNGVCSALETNTGTLAQVPPIETQTNPGQPNDLVTLTGIPTRGPIDNRVRACMEPFVRTLFARAQANGLSIVLTSAYRAGAITAGGRPSAHGRGEAVDVAFVTAPPQPWGTPANPSLPMNPFNIQRQQQIDRLFSLSLSVGFKPLQGDTLDEYNFRNDLTSGPHMHMEFNAGYCGIYQG